MIKRIPTLTILWANVTVLTLLLLQKESHPTPIPRSLPVGAVLKGFKQKGMAGYRRRPVGLYQVVHRPNYFGNETEAADDAKCAGKTDTKNNLSAPSNTSQEEYATKNLNPKPTAFVQRQKS